MWSSARASGCCPREPLEGVRWQTVGRACSAIMSMRLRCRWLGAACCCCGWVRGPPAPRPLRSPPLRSPGCCCLEGCHARLGGRCARELWPAPCFSLRVAGGRAGRSILALVMGEGLVSLSWRCSSSCACSAPCSHVPREPLLRPRGRARCRMASKATKTLVWKGKGKAHACWCSSAHRHHRDRFTSGLRRWPPRATPMVPRRPPSLP